MKDRSFTLFVLLLLLFLSAWAIWQTRTPAVSRFVLRAEPQGVMGTVSSLVLVSDRSRTAAARTSLEAAEQELRRQEALLSTWIEASSVSRFNRAEGGETLTPATEVLAVLRLARALYDTTAGTFDITARPMMELWRLAGETNVLPSPGDLESARAESNWDQILLSESEVQKTLASTRVDIDGIAKGFAIDRAVEVLQKTGALGGMVEVGGDLRLFGQAPEKESWTVAVRSPFEDAPWAELAIEEGAVCSSGDYARFIEVDGRRFSHIIDPRNGWPTEQTHAVTVVGPDAASADAWATALSILGAAGLDLLDSASGFEAMVVSGSQEDYTVRTTPGFRQILVRTAFELAD